LTSLLLSHGSRRRFGIGTFIDRSRRSGKFALLHGSETILSGEDGEGGRSNGTQTMGITPGVRRPRERFKDALFNSIEDMQEQSGNPSFGRFLDAGTGLHSLRWIASLLEREDDEVSEETVGLSSKDVTNTFIEKFTAITADESMRKNVRIEASKLGIDTTDESGRAEILIGNWANDMIYERAESAREVASAAGYLCYDELYDTILADYLVGAMDGFSPYYQDRIFDRLKVHLKPSGRLYVIGLQPIPDKANGDADLFCRVTRLRDSCILLAGHRCYREYPLDWIVRHMKKSGFDIVKTEKHPIQYSYIAMKRQLDVARSKLPLFPSKGLAEEMKKTIDNLDAECKAAIERSPRKRIQIGFDYIVCGEMKSS